MAHIKMFAGWRINSGLGANDGQATSTLFSVMRLLAYVCISNQQDLVARLKKAMKEGQRQ
jgi:hypothetical protein